MPKSFVAVALILFVAASASAQAPDSLSVQGVLTDTSGVVVVDANYSLLFKLYKNGSAVWEENHPSVEVKNGGFNVLLGGTTPLDTMAFDVPLELGVTVSGDPEMSPRTPLTSAPYAKAMPGLYTQYRDDGSLRSYNVVGGAVNNVVGAGVIGATIGGGGGFLVTSPLPNSVLANFGTVGGGGSNTASGSVATVGGGNANTAVGAFSTVGGGAANTASATKTTVGGGGDNSAGAGAATVAGGSVNTASGYVSTVGGGYFNTASGDSSTVAGGANNEANGYGSAVGGGAGNGAVDGSFNTVGGGAGNTTASGSHNTVGGGANNKAGGSTSTIGGGAGNRTADADVTISGGSDNFAWGWRSTIGGGRSNIAGTTATVGGGTSNIAGGGSSTVGGGSENTATGTGSTIPGGRENSARGYTSFAVGYKSKAIHDGTFVWNDRSKTSGNDSLVSTEENQFLVRAAGGVGIGTNSPKGVISNAQLAVLGGHVAVDNDFGFLSYNKTSDGFGAGLDTTDDDDLHLYAGGAGKVTVLADGKVGIGNFITPGHPLEVGVWASGTGGNGAHVTSGGVWTNGSSRQLKTDFESINKTSVLEAVASLPVKRWRYKGEDTALHMGPVAEDFRDAFGLGADARYIGTVDADGVALAAIQGLYELVKEQQAEIERMRAAMARAGIE